MHFNLFLQLNENIFKTLFHVATFQHLSIGKQRQKNNYSGECWKINYFYCIRIWYQRCLFTGQIHLLFCNWNAFYFLIYFLSKMPQLKDFSSFYLNFQHCYLKFKIALLVTVNVWKPDARHLDFWQRPLKLAASLDYFKKYI